MIEIRLLVIQNAFKRQAEESDHPKVCVEGMFRRNLYSMALIATITAETQTDPLPQLPPLKLLTRVSVASTVSSQTTAASVPCRRRPQVCDRLPPPAGIR